MHRSQNKAYKKVLPTTLSESLNMGYFNQRQNRILVEWNIRIDYCLVVKVFSFHSSKIIFNCINACFYVLLLMMKKYKLYMMFLWRTRDLCVRPMNKRIKSTYNYKKDVDLSIFIWRIVEGNKFVYGCRIFYGWILIFIVHFNYNCNIF